MSIIKIMSIRQIPTNTKRTRMHTQLLQSQTLPFEPNNQDSGDIRRAFFKCTKWQLEETLDPINCPYHYYCNSTYPGDYPSWVDNLVLVFTSALFLATGVWMLIELMSWRKPVQPTRPHQLRRYFLPSGPVFLPIILVILAKGYRINTVFPLLHNGPTILQLLRISALAFETETENDIKYVFLEASTISGILHAALYLDFIIMPYYTGLDALLSSTFSGECLSCVCRKQVLVAGGTLVFYRGWSVTTALVVGALLFRIFCRLIADGTGKAKMMRFTMEGLSWMLITVECAYLLIVSPRESSRTKAAGYGGLFVLICLHLIKRVSTLIVTHYFSKQEYVDRYLW